MGRPRIASAVADPCGLLRGPGFLPGSFFFVVTTQTTAIQLNLNFRVPARGPTVPLRVRECSKGNQILHNNFQKSLDDISRGMFKAAASSSKISRWTRPDSLALFDASVSVMVMNALMVFRLYFVPCDIG